MIARDPLIPSDYPHGVRECPLCGRLVDLGRYGQYRRHYPLEPDGRRHLCPASGQMEVELGRVAIRTPGR